MSREITTEFTVAAPPEKVWRVLADTAAYGQWNPVIPRLRHRRPLVSGSRAFISLALSQGGLAVVIPVRMRCVDHCRELSWEGGPPGLLRGFHYHRLFAVEADGHDGQTLSTRVQHGEVFTGALTSVVWRGLEPTLRAGYERFNRALTARAEGLAPRPR